MRFMNGLQIRLAAGLLVGLAAFWTAAPPVSSVDGSTIGGWMADNWTNIAVSTTPVNHRYYDHFQVEQCSWFEGPPSCYGGSLDVAVESSVGRQIKPSGLVPCYGNACTQVYEGTWQ